MFEPTAIRDVRKRVVEEHAHMAHDLTFLRHTVLIEIATAAGYTEFLVDEAFAVFDEVRNDVEMYPEARPALRALSERFCTHRCYQRQCRSRQNRNRRFL